MAQLGKIVMNKTKVVTGMATKSTIAALFGKAPQFASDMMIELLAQHRGKSLEHNLMKLGTVEFDRDDEYTWDLIGSSKRNIPLLEARVAGTVVADGDDNIGADGAEFELVFGEDWFYEGMIIAGEKPDIYQMIIKKIYIESVDNIVCTCEMVGGNIGGVPAEEVLPGKRYSIETTPVSDELSRERFGGNFTTPTDMRGEFSTLRYGHKVTGTANTYNFKMAMPIMDDAGKVKKFTAWMPYIQYKIEAEFSDMKNRLLMYARTNRRADGLYLNKDHKTNLALKMGSGFREQMEVSNTIFYSKFDIKLIENLLLDLSESKLGFGDRLFVMKTGERGAVQFSKAVFKIASGWSAFSYLGGSNNPNIITQATSELHTNPLSAGFQFVEYRAPNGVILRVEVDPIYDDRERNKLEHPDGGVAESYRYDIYYLGSQDNPNMKIAKVKGLYDRRGFQSGPFGNPFLGTTSSDNASWDEDSAVMHVQTTLGSILYDASRTASLIPSILQ